MTAHTDPPVRVDLAHEPDFRLGELLLQPSACVARVGGRDRRLEPRVMEVLVLLARAANHTVSRDDLIETCWGGRFVSDDAVTRVISKVRAVSRAVDPAPFQLETVPKVGFRLVTPDSEDGADRGGVPAQPAAKGARRWTSARAGALALALLAVGAASGWALWRVTANPPPPGTAAGAWVDVAEFRPLQDDPALRRLAVLSNDAIARALAANGVDPAPGRASAARLGLTGTVDRDGDRYVINARIQDRRSGALLWSRRFDRSIGDAAGFQETTANHVSDVLRCGRVRAQAYRGTMPDRLLAMFLDACFAARLEAEPARFVEVTRRIVEVAPNLSTAWSLHAHATARAADGYPLTPEQETQLRSQARAAALRAIGLDSGNGEAFAALALSYRSGGHWLERETYLRQALKRGWTAADNGYIWLLLDVGRMQEATAVADRTVATEPFSTNALERLAWLQAVTGETTLARRTLERLQVNDPAAADEAYARIVFWYEDPDRATRELRTIEGKRPPQDLACTGQFLAGGWLREGSRPSGLPAACDNQQTSWRVRMLARSGQIDAAYRELSARSDWRDSTIFLFYPEMKRFRQDPRFMRLAKSLGLVDYWSRTNRWPDFCQEPDLPYDCRTAAQAA